MKRFARYVLTTSLLSCHLLLMAGDGKITARQANELYITRNYKEALEQYKYLLQKDEKNLEYNFRVAVCYLNTYINKPSAIPYLKTVIDLDALDGKTNYAIAFYLLGRAHHYNYEFQDAIAMYEKFIEQEGITLEDEELAKQKLQFCYNAIELMKFPVDVSFHNLGKGVNSEFAEYYAFIPEDESFIMYTSKRDEQSTLIEDGSYSSNVYYSSVINGKFKKSRLLRGPINSRLYNEAIIGLSQNGEEALFFIENEDDNLDLFHANIEGDRALNLEVLEADFQSEGLEIAAFIDSAGTTMYISSTRKGGYGGADIYRAKKLPTGHWGKIQNLGPEINTPYDDVFPSLSPDEKTLYFSSEGHTSMGGLDIFKAEWDAKNQKWTSIKNMGHPINTPEDNMNFRVSKSGKYGYISAFRPGGYGDLDIYKVDFNSIESRYTVVAGKIYAVNTQQLIDDVFIEVTTNGSGELYGEVIELYGQYIPNPISGRFVIILPPGNYDIRVEKEGFESVVEGIEILDKSDYRTFIEQDLVLKPENLFQKLPELEEGLEN